MLLGFEPPREHQARRGVTMPFTPVFLSIHSRTRAKTSGNPQYEMFASGHTDKCLGFVRALEPPLRQIWRDDTICVAVNNKNRDMDVANREIRAKLVEH
jgi:hypothetical protein